MIVGTISIDPRRIIDAEIIEKAGKCWLQVEWLIGEGIRQSETAFDDMASALAALKRIDDVAYKTMLADAVSDKVLELEADDDEE